MKVYSPSATSVWERCPYLREYERGGWHTRLFEWKDLAAIAGRAFAAAMAYYNTAKRDALPIDIAQAQSVAQVEYNIGVDAVLANEGTWDAKALEMQGEVGPALLDAIQYTIRNDATPPEWQVVGVEEDLGARAGYARPDVIYTTGYDNEKGRMVRDYKFQLVIDKRYEEKEVKRYLDSTQARHYLLFTGARFFHPLIVVAKPKPHFVNLNVMLERDDTALRQWLDSQGAKWDIMEQQEQGRLPLWESERHEDQFGQCPAYESCFTHHRNGEQMKASGQYIQIARL